MLPDRCIPCATLRYRAGVIPRGWRWFAVPLYRVAVSSRNTAFRCCARLVHSGNICECLQPYRRILLAFYPVVNIGLRFGARCGDAFGGTTCYAQLAIVFDEAQERRGVAPQHSMERRLPVCSVSGWVIVRVRTATDRVDSAGSACLLFDASVFKSRGSRGAAVYGRATPHLTALGSRSHLSPATGSDSASERVQLAAQAPNHCMQPTPQPVINFACANLSPVWCAADAGC